MACSNRHQHRMPPNTISSNCGKPLGFPSKIDLITWDKNVYDQIVSGGGWRECGDSWVYDDTGARGVLSNDIVGNASEDPLLYAMAKRKYYKERPTNPWNLNSIYNKPYFNEMTGESNYTDGELTNLPRNRSAMMASIGIASSPFDYPNESRLRGAVELGGRDTPPTGTSPLSIPTDRRITTGGTTNVRSTYKSLDIQHDPIAGDPIAPDLTGNPQVPESGPGSKAYQDDTLDGYPTLPDEDEHGGGGGGGGGGMPMGGGEPLDEPLPDDMMGNGEIEERKYMGMTKKQAIIALIALVVAYYWWKNRKK